MSRRARNRPARRLRVSIDALPEATKRAMLEGVRSGPIITGAYTSQEGTCPMLAAHRRGGRTSLATFARAWDGYTRTKRARLATERELRTLEAMLVTSLGEEESPAVTDLGRAIAEHRSARARREPAEPRVDSVQPTPERRSSPAAPGDPHRTPELRDSPGWAWLRVFRRLDDYEAALAEARRQEADSAERDRPLAGAVSAN